MKTAILAASVVALALSAGPTLAARKHAMGPTAAEPKQPIPYSELNAYLKASPKQRATRDWWSGASTGMAANTASATPAPTAGADTSSTTASSPTASTTPDAAKAPPTEGAASTSSSSSSTAATSAPTPDPAATPTPPK